MTWLHKLSEEIDRASLTWSFLREPEYVFTETVVACDIDIWCSRSDMIPLISIVADKGWVVDGGRQIDFELSGNHSSVVRFSHPNISQTLEFWFGSLRADAIEMLSEKEVENSRERISGAPFLKLEIQLFMLTVRPMLLGRGVVGYRQRAIKVYAKLTEYQRECFDVLVRSVVSVKVAGELESYLANDTKIPSVSSVQRLIRNVKSLGVWSSLRLVFLKTNSMMQKYLFSTKGVLVTLIGVDGVGKTTLIQAMLESHSPQGVASVVYLGRSKGNSSVVRIVRNLVFGVFKFKEKKKGIWVSASGDRETRVLKVFSFVVYFVEYWARYIYLKWATLIRSQSIYGDRGCLDLTLVNGLGNVPERISTFLPGAHLSIFCHAPVDTILSRKQERTDSEIVRQQGILHRVFKKIPMSEQLQLNTSQPLSDSLNRIVFAVSVVNAQRRGILDKGLAGLLMSTISTPIP